MTKYLMVGIGGFLGSMLRFWVGGALDSRMGPRFPYGTFVINITGSFLLGLIVTVLSENAQWSPNWRYLLPIGFVGAYTTFSTFELETFRGFESGAWLVVFLNIVLSVSLGFLGVYLGIASGHAITRRESHLTFATPDTIGDVEWARIAEKNDPRSAVEPNTRK